MTRLVRACVVAAIGCATWASTVQAADPPGTYVVSMCRAQDRPLPLTGWRKSDDLSPLFSNTCGTERGSFGFSAAGALPSSWPFAISWRWDAPPDLRIAGFRHEGLMMGAGFIADVRADSGSVGFGSPLDGASAGSRWREVQNLSASRLVFEIRCGWPDDPECKADGSGAVIALEQLDLVLRDEFLPAVTSSTLASTSSAGPAAGTLNLTTGFVDRGGGIAQVELLVDGAVSKRLSTDAAGCVKPYVVPVPCPTTGRVEIALDTTTLANGAHNVELRLVDVAGNRAAVGPAAVVVQNRIPLAPGASTPGRVSLRKATVRGGYGANLRLEGVVAGLDDAPLAGVAVNLATRVLANGAAFTAASPVVTDGAGRFSIPVEPGPSRVYRLRYGTSEATAEVVVRAPLKLSVSPSKTRNGRTIRFRGSIVGATAPGVRVELQARAGKKWVPFRTAALKRSGFTASYRFTNTTARTRYKFRAVVRADPDLPYAPATSKIVQVLVRP